MKKLIGLLVVLVALMGLTVTELVWGGGEADAESAEITEVSGDADQPTRKTVRTRRGSRR